MSVFYENKWYLVSPIVNGEWNTVKEKWINDGLANSDVKFHNIIYQLKEPVQSGANLTENNWKQINVTTMSEQLLSHIGYFVYVTNPGTSSTIPTEPTIPTDPQYLALKYTINYNTFLIFPYLITNKLL